MSTDLHGLKAGGERIVTTKYAKYTDEDADLPEFAKGHSDKNGVIVSRRPQQFGHLRSDVRVLHQGLAHEDGLRAAL